LTRTVVHLSSNNELSKIFRQTPNNDGVWEDYRFVQTDPDGRADWFVAYDEPKSGVMTTLPRARRVLFMSEPKTIKYYPKAYVEQFGAIVTILPDERFSGRQFVTNNALPWMYGMDLGSYGESTYCRNWEELQRGPQAKKTGLISVVCSKKQMNLNQARRLRFLDMLKEALGDRLTVYGRGFNPISDKAEAIDGYRYHLALENNLLENGWTEKLADPILGGAFPIVSAGPGLERFFNPEGFRRIDTTRPRAGVQEVLRVLEEDPAASAQEAMSENRLRLMETHQFFPLCVRVLKDLAGEPEASERLSEPHRFIVADKPKWRKLVGIPKPLRKPLRKAYLAAFERG
jgi:hypothetical protein